MSFTNSICFTFFLFLWYWINGIAMQLVPVDQSSSQFSDFRDDQDGYKANDRQLGIYAHDRRHVRQRSRGGDLRHLPRRLSNGRNHPLPALPTPFPPRVCRSMAHDRQELVWWSTNQPFEKCHCRQSKTNSKFYFILFFYIGYSIAHSANTISTNPWTTTDWRPSDALE